MLKEGGRKINYVKFIRESADEDFRAALGRLSPLIAGLDFGAIVSETPYLTDLQRRFYRVYLDARREAVLNRSLREEGR